MLGRTNTGGGGGGGLNFQVVGGSTAPSNAKENMIWVNTSTTISSWVFSATQPTAATGKVWITIYTSSTVAFNALKKNGIQVYPVSAKQYVGGSWVDKTAKSWQGGAWVDWVTYLFNNGDKCEDITGGWTSSGYTNSSSSLSLVNASIGNTLSLSATNKQCLCGTVNKIPFGEANKTMIITVTERTGDNGVVYLTTTKDLPNNILSKKLVVGENYVDISGVTKGSYYVVFLASSGAAKLTVTTVTY